MFKLRNPQKYTTVEEQIEILKKRNLSFENEELAKSYLESYGYYSIINGYKTHYANIINGEDYYKDGVTFEQIFSLFIFDHTIRNNIMLCMLDIEENLRAVTAKIIAELYSSDHTKYLKKELYRDRKQRKSIDERFTRDGILNTMRQELHSSHNPIKYSMDKYGNVPPWILFKGLFFNTLVNFIRIQKNESKTRIMCQLYGITNPEQLELSEIKNLFTDSLFIFLSYRNTAAHGGRVYNLHPKPTINFNKALKNELSKIMPAEFVDEFENSYGLFQLLLLLRLLNHKAPYRNLLNSINYALSQHCCKYPQDIEYLCKTTGISLDIVEFEINDKVYNLRDFLTEDGKISAKLNDAINEAATTDEE